MLLYFLLAFLLNRGVIQYRFIESFMLLKSYQRLCLKTNVKMFENGSETTSAIATAIEKMCIPSLKVRTVCSFPLRMNCAIRTG